MKKWTCFLLFVPVLAAHASDEATKSLLSSEGTAIAKIEHFTANEHSAILFTVAEQLIGYARDGHVKWINSNHNPGTRHIDCGWPHAVLSHDGLAVAFVADADQPNQCEILIHNMSTGADRKLVHTARDPGEISWSWDDSELAFFDRGISAVSVRDGTRRELLSLPIEKIGPHEFDSGCGARCSGFTMGGSWSLSWKRRSPRKSPRRIFTNRICSSLAIDRRVFWMLAVGLPSHRNQTA